LYPLVIIVKVPNYNSHEVWRLAFFLTGFKLRLNEMFESAFPEYELWPNVKAVAHIKQLLPTLLYRVCLLLHIELILVNGHVTL
jgi:hypothetical protein